MLSPSSTGSGTGSASCASSIPACGCGNFLIIAYRELRLLEIDILDEIAARTRLSAQQTMPFEVKSVIDVDQFYGIEISEFPARIAATSLWMMDHLMNRELAGTFGKPYVRIPLEKSPHIEVGDALEIDWTAFLPPAECSYVFGNPPFIGAKYQSTEQRAQVRPHRPTRRQRRNARLRDRMVHPRRRIRSAKPALGLAWDDGRRGSGSSRPTRSPRVSRSDNSGRSSSTGTTWRSHTRTEHSHGAPTRAARHTSTSSSSVLTQPSTP